MDTLQTIIHRPVILGSTWYAYLREESVPWGVAQHDLLVGQLPSSLLFAESIVCDEKAFRQEMLARDVMKWASSEVLGLLEQEGIVQPRDFRADVKAIFENPVVREQAELLLSPPFGDAPLLRRIRDLDNLLTDGLAAPAGDSTQEAMNVCSWGSSPLPSEQRPSWATAARVLLPVFLEEDFYILPPRSIWPAAVKQAVKDIAKLQAPHLDRLARLEYTGAEYLYAIWEAHGHLDPIVDGYLRTQIHVKYGTYQDRLRHLFRIRKKLHDGRVQEFLALLWAKLGAGHITEAEFIAEANVWLRAQSDDLIGTVRTAKTKLACSIAISVLSLAAWNGDAQATYFGSLGISAVSLIKGIQEMRRIRDRQALGWHKIG